MTDFGPCLSSELYDATDAEADELDSLAADGLGRRIDRLDVGTGVSTSAGAGFARSPFSQASFSQSDAGRLNALTRALSTEDMLRAIFRDSLLGKAAIVSSFGAESVVLLHLIARFAAIPVLFLDTGKHFPETLAYRDTINERLKLTIITLTPDAEQLAAKDATGLRWSYDPDGCCAIRKVAPLEKALAAFDTAITGRKGFQSRTRAQLSRFAHGGESGRMQFNPLADWTHEEITAYFAKHDLPRHPLEAQGYPSIGCLPCTSKVRLGEDPRAGRWRGWDKTECGIHNANLPQSADDDGANDPVF